MARWSDRLTQGPALWTAGYFVAVLALVLTTGLAVTTGTAVAWWTTTVP